jgi:hypothetical protein
MAIIYTTNNTNSDTVDNIDYGAYIFTIIDTNNITGYVAKTVSNKAQK